MNYALFAESTHLIRGRLNQIIKDIQKKYDAEVVTYDMLGQETSLYDVLNEANTLPFLSEHKIVVVQNAAFLTAKETLDEKMNKALERYFKADNPNATLIFYNDSGNIDNRKKTTKLVKKYCDVFEPKPFSELDVESRIRNDLTKNHLKIEDQALRLLIERLFNNFDNWDQELEKLILYHAEVLTVEDIDVLIGENQIDNVFKISDAIVNQDLDQALLYWRDQPIANKEPIGMMMLVASQFRLIHQVQTLLKLGYYDKQIASELKVHPFRVSKAVPVARNHSSDAMLKVLSLLADLDQDIKKGAIDPQVGFELFLLKVCEKS